jgi:hypothetical protein
VTHRIQTVNKRHRNLLGKPERTVIGSRRRSEIILGERDMSSGSYVQGLAKAGQ